MTPGNKPSATPPEATAELDIRDSVCPMTFVRVKVALDELAEGDVLAISLNDGEPVENVPRSLKDEGHKVLRLDKQKDGSYRLLAKKGPEG